MSYINKQLSLTTKPKVKSSNMFLDDTQSVASELNESQDKTDKSFHSKKGGANSNSNTTNNKSKSEIYKEVQSKSKNYLDEYQNLLKASDLNELDISDDELQLKDLDDSTLDHFRTGDMIDENNKKKKAERNKIIKDNEKYYCPFENERQVRLIEEKIDREIEEEERKKSQTVRFDPVDEEKANTLLREDKYIREACDKGLVERWEIITYIDYYEFFSKINYFNKKIRNDLDNISKECVKDLNRDDNKYWEKLKQKVEDNLEWKDSIIDNSARRARRNIELSNNINNNTNNLNCSSSIIRESLMENSTDLAKSQNCLKESSESNHKSFSAKNLKEVENKFKPKLKAIPAEQSTNTSKIGTNTTRITRGLSKNKPVSSSKPTNNNTETDLTSSVSSTNSNFKGNKKTLPSIKKCIDLFDDNMKMVKMQANRSNRKDIIAQNHQPKKKDLFTFDAKKLEVATMSNFMDLLELPKEAIEKEKNLDWIKKSSTMRKIEDAMSMYKK